MSGIQTGDSAVNKILAGTWTFERTDADKKTDEGSASQILPSTDTGAKETTDVKEPGTIRELTFRTNGTGTYTDANGTPLAFEIFGPESCIIRSIHSERNSAMSRKTRKRGRRRLLVIVVLLALIVFGVFARGLLTSGKTTAERAQRELDSYAEKNDASLDDYPDALVQLYARNPDARDFVRDYPKKKDLTPTIDLSGLAGSETVPLLLQWDERWGYREYNESIIGLAGCGPTCLSMVTIYLTGDTTKDPLWMCQFAEAHQFNVPGSGSKWALISEGGRMLGLDVTQIPLDKDRIYRNLDVGNPIIVVVGPGDFTTDGHFLVLTGRDGDKITLNDPNSPTNSQKSWDYDTLAGQIQSLWVLRRAG